MIHTLITSNNTVAASSFFVFYTNFQTGIDEKKLGSIFFLIAQRILVENLLLPSTLYQHCLLISTSSFILISTPSTAAKLTSSVPIVDEESRPEPAWISLNIAIT